MQVARIRSSTCSSRISWKSRTADTFLAAVMSHPKANLCNKTLVAETKRGGLGAQGDGCGRRTTEKKGVTMNGDMAVAQKTGTNMEPW